MFEQRYLVRMEAYRESSEFADAGSRLRLALPRPAGRSSVDASAGGTYFVADGG